MTKIVGPYITKEVTIPEVVIPEHVVTVFDGAAYWWLDWEGNEDAEGTFGYAKVAFPLLSDAQRQHEMEAAQAQARRGTKRKPRRGGKVQT